MQRHGRGLVPTMHEIVRGEEGRQRFREGSHGRRDRFGPGGGCSVWRVFVSPLLTVLRRRRLPFRRIRTSRPRPLPLYILLHPSNNCTNHRQSIARWVSDSRPVEFLERGGDWLAWRVPLGSPSSNGNHCANVYSCLRCNYRRRGSLLRGAWSRSKRGCVS